MRIVKGRAQRRRGSARARQEESYRDLQKAETLHSRALQVASRGKYAEAARLFRRAISFASGSLHSDPLLLAALLNDFGVLSKYQRRFERAEGLYDRAAALIPRHHPCSAEARATLLHNLAGLEHARGRGRQAMLLARRGLRSRRSLRPVDAGALAADEAALAAILVDLGRLREAETILRRVLRAYRRNLGEQHYETAFVLANLGALCAKDGDLKAAERALRRALSDLERALGRSHPRLRSVRNNLAIVCSRRRKLGESQDFTARQHRR